MQPAQLFCLPRCSLGIMPPLAASFPVTAHMQYRTQWNLDLSFFKGMEKQNECGKLLHIVTK
jgi:hypothetical protein